MKKILALLLAGALICSPFAVSAKYESYVETAREDGVVTGDETGDFDEDKIASRGEFAVMLVKFLNISGGMNVFLDVKSSDWFAPAMAAANHHSLLVGDENGMARPYAPIKREDAVTVLGRYYHATSESCKAPEIVADYAERYWGYAEEKGLIDESLAKNPADAVTKGELLKLIYDYDNHVSSGIRFLPGYPKLSQKGIFDHISVDVKTNKPCTVYYRICEADMGAAGSETELCRAQEKTVVSAKIKADINKTYNIHLRAVDESGAWKSVVLENVQPFAIPEGNGTEESPYIVHTSYQLSQLSAINGGFYKLGGNIDITGDWKPIENFSGTLDGNGYQINMEKADDSGCGLFGILNGGTLRNLTVYANIKTGKNGGIIASINDKGIIENCTALGTVEVKTDGAGGICGQNKGSIRNCLSAAYSVAAGSFAGGICGQNFGEAESCLSATEVIASEMYAGGISGTNDSGLIENCVSASMTIYDTLTTNSGRLTTNRKGGKVKNNYCYEGVISNASYEEPGINSQNGFDVSWDRLCDAEFYRDVGWNIKLWNTKKNNFRLIYPQKTQEPQLIAGKTMYLPKAIVNQQQLREIDADVAGHYILKNDIYLTLPWKTICQKGFSGTFEGNGYTVYNLNLKGESGMFSNITGGTVKNLILKNVTAAPTSAGAILAACNYGYIEDCEIYGKIEAKKTGYIGTVTGENHGLIKNCRVQVDIVNNHANATIGGICAENDGLIQGSTYSGKITAKSENAVIGGICGYDTGGNVFECFSSANISLDADSGYVGGVCGIITGTQVYKCASSGSIVSEVRETAYMGGVCALAETAAVYNCFSVADVYAIAGSGYAGGICGCNSGSNVQNTYSAGNVIASQAVAAGGICGFAENGFIMQNVVLNPSISSGEEIGAVVGKKNVCAIADNYSCEKTLINSKHIVESDKNAQVKNFTVLTNPEFYFTPISLGGLLGWEEDVWSGKNTGYPFPTLVGVDGQDLLKAPMYK